MAAVFSPAKGPRDPNELRFVGMIRRVKRVGTLLRALAEVRVAWTERAMSPYERLATEGAGRGRGAGDLRAGPDAYAE